MLHALKIPCVHTSHMEICESETQLKGGIVGARVHIQLFIVQDNGCVDKKKVSAVVMIKEMVAVVVLRGDKCIS